MLGWLAIGILGLLVVATAAAARVAPILVSVLPVLVAFLIGKVMWGWKAAWILAVPALVGPAFWGWIGYSRFLTACESGVAGATFLKPPAKPVWRFLLEPRRDASQFGAQGQLNRHYLVATGAFESVKLLEGSRPAPGTEVVVREMPLKRASSRWLPAIYTTGLEVVSPTGEAMARATEFVFAGGKLGPLTTVLDRDFYPQALGCGYVSIRPLPWRPVGGLAFEWYLDADRRFLVRALRGACPGDTAHPSPLLARPTTVPVPTLETEPETPTPPVLRSVEDSAPGVSAPRR